MTGLSPIAVAWRVKTPPNLLWLWLALGTVAVGSILPVVVGGARKKHRERERARQRQERLANSPYKRQT